MNVLAEKLEYPMGTVAVALVNGKSEQSLKMLERAGEAVSPDWTDFNSQQCLRLTLPCPRNTEDFQAHRFHMTMVRLLLSHVDALVGYKYCNGVYYNDSEVDVWIARRWIAEQNTQTQHRVLPKRLAEPINRLITVVSDLCSHHEASASEA